MKYLTLAFLLCASALPAQSVAKRDSSVADSLTRLRPYLNGWRLTTLNTAISVLRAPLVPVPVPVNTAPVARITSVTCDALRKCAAVSGSTDDKAVTGYQWGWGDGASSTAQFPTHTYLAAGTYTVSLTVRDIEGLTSSTTRAVTITAAPPDSVTINRAPTAVIALSCDNTLLRCSGNGSASTDDVGVTGYLWYFGDGSAHQSGVTVTHQYAAGGTYTVDLTTTDAAGLTATASKPITIAGTTPPPPPPPADTVAGVVPMRAELPRAVPVFTIPAASRTTRLTATSDLQAAVNAAVGGDSIVLPAGATYAPITLPTRPCGSWVTITSAGTLPPAGTRVTPATAALFAKIVTTNSGRAVQTAQPTCGWRLVGLEIAATASAGVSGVSLNYGIVWLGDGGWTGGGETQRSLAQVPQQILLDRVWIHGAATTNTTRCLKLDSGNTIIRDSYLSDCHALGSDSQAILGCNGPGPFLIENNYLEGAGENVMFGGCDPAAPELIPSDITFRRNHVVKPLGYKGVWTAKNPFELKDARRVLVEANVFENSWISAQLGMCIVVKSSTETDAAATWEGSKDVTIRWNVFKNCHRGLNLQAIDGSSAGTTASHTERVTVEQNLFTGIGTVNGIAPSDGWLVLLTHDLKDISISRNTFVSNTPAYGLAVYTAYGNGAARRVSITDNIFAGQSYYALAGDGGNHAAALTAFAGTSWTFQRNVVAQVNQEFWAASPSGNTYLAAVSALGLTSTGASTAYPTVGADIAEITRRTLGVIVP